MDLSDEYYNLANAIIERAADDYRIVLSGYEESYGQRVNRKELEKFFQSAWFECLTRVNGKNIMERIRKEYE